MVCVLGTTGTASARVIASSGFNPKKNGFSFPNYGPGHTNLSANDMRALFGSGVCAFPGKSKCTLTPPAQRYQQEANRAMAAGHCFGFSALSLLLFRHQFPPLAKTSTNKLKLNNNTPLQEAIAYTFQWQMLPALQEAAVRGTPNEVLQFLISSLQRRGGELYTMAIFQPEFQGGHAITPYAVEERGAGKYDALVYDNNWPGQSRHVHFDTSTDTWSYNAAINPGEPESLYSGDAQTKTVTLLPTTPGLGTHFCPFCAEAAGPKAYNSIQLQGNPYNHAHLLIIDPQGRAIGYRGGAFVNQIPGARAVFPSAATTVWQQKQEPQYQIPVGVNVQVTVDGSGLKYADNEHISLIGQKHDLAVDGIEVKPGERPSLMLDGEHGSMTYTNGGGESRSPLFTVGLVTTPGNYSIGVQPVSLRPDSTVTISDDPATSRLFLHDASASEQTFELHLTRQVNGTVEKLRSLGLKQPPGRTLEVLYGTVAPGQSRFLLK
jgi:hypothetical protein